MTQSIVRAIDVGYGNTKFVQFYTQGGEVACSHFPSIAPQAGSGPDDRIAERNSLWSSTNCDSGTR